MDFLANLVLSSEMVPREVD